MYNTNNTNAQQPRIQNPQAALAAIYKYKNNFANTQECKTVKGANRPDYVQCITSNRMDDGMCYSGICYPID
uniref:Uncharacterized protein n=1 Tax=viral metagenome TaxID=1070528 RepID=A0A6C0I055_9ZZZZ